MQVKRASFSIGRTSGPIPTLGRVVYVAAVTTLADLGEIEVLRRLDSASGANPASEPDGVAVGPGDDAAVLDIRPGQQLVATTDAFVEGRHYLADWLSGEALGARLGEANLSDLAAMAAEPRWALVSLGARSDHEVDDLVAMQRGLSGSLRGAGAVIAGGNVTRVTGEEWLSLTLLGEVAAGTAWTRSGGRAGDALVVTGYPGRAGAGLLLGRRLGDAARDPRWAPLLDAWLEPKARVALALELRRSGMVTAAIDISDGLAGDLAHLCDASRVGSLIDPRGWPADPLLDDAAHALGIHVDALRFGPSDDYELLLAIGPDRVEECMAAAQRQGVPMYRIGPLTDTRGIERLTRDGTRSSLSSSGFDHFASR